MDTRLLRRKPLRDLVVEAERICRELSEHVQQDFTHAIHDLERTVRPSRRRRHDVTEVTVRNVAGRALKSDDFTEELFTKLEAYLNAISEAAGRQAGS